MTNDDKKVRPVFLVALILTLWFGVHYLTQPVRAQQTGTNGYFTNPIDNGGAAGLFQVVAPTTGKSVVVNSMAFTVVTSAATGQTVKFSSCTAAGCPGGLTAITGVLSGASSTTVGTNTVYTFNGSPLFVTNSGSGVFMTVTGSQPVGGWMTGQITNIQ